MLSIRTHWSGIVDGGNRFGNCHFLTVFVAGEKRHDFIKWDIVTQKKRIHLINLAPFKPEILNTTMSIFKPKNFPRSVTPKKELDRWSQLLAVKVLFFFFIITSRENFTGKAGQKKRMKQCWLLINWTMKRTYRVPGQNKWNNYKK